ncbi:MAG: hypothetical protein KAJ73_04845 [Zetaproteobacteria bacterium]|nr:hypothetical protein [Zetaproteobacteria bacterium]
MNEELGIVKAGLAMVLLGLMFGIALGVTFGVNEDGVKGFITEEIAAHPEVHDEKSKTKIWRYAQRAHFHATGISAYSLGLIILVMFSSMKRKIKSATSILIGLSSFYPLAWFVMFLVAPSIGREPAHHHYLTELFTYLGVGGLVTGMLLLIGNLFFGLLGETDGA